MASLPDGGDLLVDLPRRWGSPMRGGRLLDPIKTTKVQDERCMTTRVIEKAYG
jgi:hypothetical protein